MKTLYVALAVLALALPSSEALAKDKGKAKGKAAKADKGRGNRRVVFVDADRQAVRTWRRETYGSNCPPGLAKKDNGCLPPGQAKKRYVVGQRLPSIVVIEPVPRVLLPRLSVAPAGYRYAYVDGDVLLINAASRLVADVIIDVLD